MEESGGTPLIESQLSSLKARIEDLERENARLLGILSNCRCSRVSDTLQEGDAVSCSPVVVVPSSCLPSDCLESSCRHVVEDEVAAGLGSGLSIENSSNIQGLHSADITGRSLRSTHQYMKRYIALKIMYFGQRFYGFASEAQKEPTIESEFFKALRRTKLVVGMKEDTCYSRCGRTDKGVSSTGQVVALYLRSNIKGKEECRNEEKEIDYVRVLNRVLPSDIRVMGWCPIPSDFHARFSCQSRQYKYFFWKGTLDISAMKIAASKFIGKHDFRNFCKMDAANVHNYKREITSFKISFSNMRHGNEELWEMSINGTAFLWHQVRCMVAVLFMIGQGLELPDVIDLMLDIDKVQRKPQYNMAPDLPLVLQFCEFKDINFLCSSESTEDLHRHFLNQIQNFMLQVAIHQEGLDCLAAEGQSVEYFKKKKGHISLMVRPTEPSFEERRAKLHSKGTC